VWQVSRKSPPAHSLVGCLAIGCTARTKLRLAVTLRSSSPSSKHIEAVCSTAASQQSLALRWLNNAPVFARRPNHEWPARFVGFSPAWREGLRPAALSLLHFQSVRRGCTSRRAIAAGSDNPCFGFSKFRDLPIRPHLHGAFRLGTARRATSSRLWFLLGKGDWSRLHFFQLHQQRRANHGHQHFC
jgi:hypothetical protein